MPYQLNKTDPNFKQTDALPKHLDHKPIYALPYETFDGKYAGRTDVRYLSIGFAQYDQHDVSIKIMRHTGVGGKWSRQSEELPLHRPIDMTIFLAKTLFDSTPSGSVTIPAGTFQKQPSDVIISQESLTDGEISAYGSVISIAAPMLKAQLNELRKVLNDLHGQQKI